MRDPKDFQSLAEWRRVALRKTQRQIAAAVYGDGDRQPFISEIERGHMPSPLNEQYDKILHEFGLSIQPEHFERMVKNAAVLKAQKKAMTKPIAETEPLLATARSGNLEGRLARLYTEAPLIGEAELKARARA